MTSSHTPRLPVQAPEGIKSPVAVATIEEIDLEGLQVINGYQLNVNDRVLVKNQNDLSKNGIYSAQQRAWVRTKDWKVSQQVANGVLILDNNTGQLWRGIFAGVLDIGVTDVSFTDIISSGRAITYVREKLPVGPVQNGAKWYKPSEATTYVYYEDSDSGQWVEESVVPPEVAIPTYSLDSFILNQIDFAEGTRLTFVDGSIWEKTALTGTPSQTPEQRGDGTLTDATGAVWVVAGGNGVTSYANTESMQNSRPTQTGQRAENRERANAQYTLAPSGYTAKPGDITAANGRVWRLIVTGYVNPLHFGVFDDGTDVSSGFNSILSAYPNIDGQGRTFKVDDTIDASKVKTMRNINFNYSDGSPALSCLRAKGEEVKTTTLNINATKGDKNITVADATEIAPKSLLLIYSDAVFDSFNTNSKIGELAIVESVVGNVITLERGLFDSYDTSDNATVKLINPVKDIIFDNVKIYGNDTPDNELTGIEVEYGLNVKCRNVVIEQTSRRGIVYDSCILSSVTDSFFFDYFDNTTGYGVSFLGPTQNCFVSQCMFRDCRHAWTTNNSDFSPGITRFVTFENNEVINSKEVTGGSGGDAIDTHGAAEYVYIKNNKVVGSTSVGINFECASGAIIGNKIYGTLDDGIKVHNESDRQGSVSVTNNETHETGGRGIRFQQGLRGTSATYDKISITGNSVSESNSQAIYVHSLTERLASAVICNNSVITSNGGGVRIEGVDLAVISGNDIKGFGAFPLRVLDSIKTSISNNVIYNDTTNPSIYLQATNAGDTYGAVIIGNVLDGGALFSSEFGVQLTDNVENSIVSLNSMTGSNGISLGSGTGNSQINNIT